MEILLFSPTSVIAVSNSTRIGLVALALLCLFSVTRDATWKVHLAIGSILVTCGLVAFAIPIAAGSSQGSLNEEDPALAWVWGGTLALIFGSLLCIRAIVHVCIRVIVHAWRHRR
ncbi:hypothetical protein OAS39_04195 [Pirellulales bacterium]|nr:hypothetical protein [Pirellulales bacterium]